MLSLRPIAYYAAKSLHGYVPRSRGKLPDCAERWPGRNSDLGPSKTREQDYWNATAITAYDQSFKITCELGSETHNCDNETDLRATGVAPRDGGKTTDPDQRHTYTWLHIHVILCVAWLSRRTSLQVSENCVFGVSDHLIVQLYPRRISNRVCLFGEEAMKATACISNGNYLVHTAKKRKCK